MAAPLPVLVIAHQTPPLGGPGVRRVASWMRAWPECGIEPALLSAPPEDGARFHGYPSVAGSDDALAGRTVVRVATPPLRGFAGFLARTLPRRVAWTLRHRAMREPEVAWRAPAITAGLALARRIGARVVVSTSQPYEAHAVGRAIARDLALPWVADFRDPMSEAEGRWWPTRLHWALERREERRWFRDAALAWATCESAAQRWRVRFPEAAARIHVRRNGVGPMPAEAAAPLPTAPPLRLGHVGRFTDTATGSRLRRLDYRPGRDAGRGSTPRPLFAGLARFLDAHPEARGRIVWVTAGPAGDARPPDGVVDEPHGVVPHRDALAIAATCHALYLPLTTPPPQGSLIVPQKVYEYAALGRPVLVSGAPREASALLGALARNAAPDDAAAFAAHVEALWSSPPRVPAPVPTPTRDEVAAACAADLHRLAAS